MTATRGARWFAWMRWTSAGALGVALGGAAQGAGWAPGRPGIEARRATGQAEVGEARRTLDSVGNACDEACPALIAMRRGVGRLCTVRETKDDGKLCRDVRAELLANENRLRPSCGGCPSPGTDAGVADASDF